MKRFVVVLVFVVIGVRSCHGPLTPKPGPVAPTTTTTTTKPPPVTTPGEADPKGIMKTVSGSSGPLPVFDGDGCASIKRWATIGVAADVLKERVVDCAPITGTSSYRVIVHGRSKWNLSIWSLRISPNTSPQVVRTRETTDSWSDIKVGSGPRPGLISVTFTVDERTEHLDIRG